MEVRLADPSMGGKSRSRCRGQRACLALMLVAFFQWLGAYLHRREGRQGRKQDQCEQCYAAGLPEQLRSHLGPLCQSAAMHARGRTPGRETLRLARNRVNGGGDMAMG